MAENPFHYGTPVEKEQFVGRIDEVGAVVSRIRNHLSVVLLSPRRYGKTSVLLRAEAEIASANAAVVHINLLRFRDAASFAGALAGAAYHLPGARWHRSRQAVLAFVGRLRIRPTIEVGDDGKPRFEFGPSLDTLDVSLVLADVFLLLHELAAHRPAALVVDEFQAIANLGEHLPATCKALLDQYPDVSLVAAGSKRHLMEKLFVDSNAPLYNMAERIALGPIPEATMSAFLQERSRSGHKFLDPETAQLIIDVAGPVPDDIQHLAFEAFEAAGRRQAISAEDIPVALATAVGRLGELYQDIYELLPDGQRRVINQLASSPTAAPSSAEFVRLTGLANASSVKRALDGLIASELVTVRGALRQVNSPFLAAWLRGLGTTQSA